MWATVRSVAGGVFGPVALQRAPRSGVSGRTSTIREASAPAGTTRPETPTSTSDFAFQAANGLISG